MTENVPCHIGIIMDGNRRWARKNDLAAFTKGHERGAEKVKDVLRWCKARGIRVLTLYAFSSENWQRSKREVNFLMNLFQTVLSKEIGNIHKEGIKFKVIGRRELLPQALQKLIEEAELLTKDNQRGILNLAISYGGREEIIEAVRRIIKDGIPLGDITEKKFKSYLYTAGLPDPNLIIRTSGEQRTSGFLLWQSAYSEWYFCQKYWPDFLESDLDEALEEYGRRQRRFGK